MAKSGKKATTPGCWFSKLTTEELSALLKAVGAPRSGLKADLVARLKSHPVAAEYGFEARAPVLSRSTCELVGGRDGMSVDDIKDRCRARGLKVTGKRFALVLSLLATPANAPRAAPKKLRAPSKVPADTSRLVDRLRGKIGATCTSGSKWKQHAIIVVTTLTDMLSKEAFDKGRLEACDATLADATLALLSELHAGWDTITGQGYISDYVSEFDDVVNDIVAHAGLAAVTPPQTRAALLEVCERLNGAARQYGISMSLLKNAGSDDEDNDGDAYF